MDDLLFRVLQAHGGLDRWNRAKRLTARLRLGGPFWGARGWPAVCGNQTATFDAHREYIAFAPFTGPDRQSRFSVDPERIVIGGSDGEVITERLNPRASFPAEFDPLSTRWDAVQVAYFTSYAVWNYLNEPFLITYPGVEAKEIDPWQEEGATWRRLAVTFPPSIATHNADQVFYYDEQFMQRRRDYSPNVAGGAPIAHYTHDQKTFEGLVFPTRRRVHLHGENGVADQGFGLITIDIDKVGIGSD